MKSDGKLQFYSTMNVNDVEFLQYKDRFRINVEKKDAYLPEKISLIRNVTLLMSLS